MQSFYPTKFRQNLLEGTVEEFKYDFLSHKVQTKRKIIQNITIYITIFLSHKVQTKLQLPWTNLSKTRAFYPTKFRQNSCVNVSITSTSSFLSHKVQTKPVICFSAYVELLNFLSHKVQTKPKIDYPDKNILNFLSHKVQTKHSN